MKAPPRHFVIWGGFGYPAIVFDREDGWDGTGKRPRVAVFDTCARAQHFADRLNEVLPRLSAELNGGTHDAEV